MYNSKSGRSCYFPPFLSNGEIAFAVDKEGTLGYTANEYQNKGITTFGGQVVRRARRTAKAKAVNTRFFSMGSFRFDFGEECTDFSQELSVHEGCVRSTCRYPHGTTETECFIHPSLNLFALKKTFRCGEKRRVSFSVSLENEDKHIDPYCRIKYIKKRKTDYAIGFRNYGMDVFDGEICIFTDRETDFEKVGNGFTLSFDVTDGESVCFYYSVEDDLEGADFRKTLRENKRTVNRVGYQGLLSDVKAHYEEFFALGYVKTGDKDLDKIYDCALYNIKGNTTRDDIAVGFNSNSWDGKYFAFDEYFSLLGLLGANRHSLAKLVPSYRKNVCLPHAIRRASDCHRTENTVDMALFHWESADNDDFEFTSDGAWLDHYFHISLVGIGAFEYYEYTGDLEFLKECHKMIRACANFFTNRLICRDGDKVYIGKCTDLERLGAAVENPFMTACGAIRLLECCAETENILGADTDYAAECLETAALLRRNLPSDGEKYIPFKDCTTKSIAVYAGKYPFNVLGNDDRRMFNAWDDFEQNGRLFGNMYTVGSHISPWYAAWKAVAYARAGSAQKAYSALKQAFRSVGVFYEMFEINEESIKMRPWFSTAAGTFVTAVNEMLLLSGRDFVHIMPAFPTDGANISFRLAGKGGIVVDAVVVDGDLKKCTVTKGGIDVTERYKIIFKPQN